MTQVRLGFAFAWGFWSPGYHDHEICLEKSQPIQTLCLIFASHGVSDTMNVCREEGIKGRTSEDTAVAQGEHVHGPGCSMDLVQWSHIYDACFALQLSSIGFWDRMESGCSWASDRTCCMNGQTSSHSWLAHTTDQCSVPLKANSINQRIMWFYNVKGERLLTGVWLTHNQPHHSKAIWHGWQFPHTLYRWGFPSVSLLYIPKWDHVQLVQSYMHLVGRCHREWLKYQLRV